MIKDLEKLEKFCWRLQAFYSISGRDDLDNKFKELAISFFNLRQKLINHYKSISG